jgi:hypothetical protein
MTKHVSIELIGTDYIRPLDKEVMVEVKPGWFVYSEHASAKRHPANDNAAKTPKKNIKHVEPVRTELEALEHSMVESPKEISEQFVDTHLDGLFKSDEKVVSTIGGARFIDDKRRVRTKPTCHGEKSTSRWRDFIILRKSDDSLFNAMAVHAVGYQHSTLTGTLSLILTSRLDTKVGFGDTAEEARRNRFKIERYNAEYPEKENPEHTMYPRGSRNASLTRKRPARVLNPFWEYKSSEPLQTNYLQADNDNNGYDPDSVEGDMKKPLRDAEAEWEMRPSPEEMAARYSVPTVQYKTRQVGLITGPKLSDCGYCMSPTSPLIREMKIPVSGDVECIGISKVAISDYEDAARISLAVYELRQATFPKPHWPRAMEETQEQIDTFVNRIAKRERINISDVDMSRKWSLFRIGELYFAPYGTETLFRGALFSYGSNGGMFPAKDKCGTPYGAKSKGSADQNDKKDMAKKGWQVLHPRTEREVEYLSPADKARQLANKPKPVLCPPPTDDELQAFRLKMEANGKPGNDNRKHDGLPYDVKSRDELQFGHAFGATSAETKNPEPFDVERQDFLAVFNAGSPQARLVASMDVLTDEAVGAALWTGRMNASKSTLIRHGKKAKDDIAKELSSSFQELAA